MFQKYLILNLIWFQKKRWFELYFTLRHIFKFMKNNFRCFETFSDFKEITKKITRFAPLSILKQLRRKKDFSIEKKFKNTFLGGFWVWNSWKNTFLGWFLLYWACFGTGFWYTSRQNFKKSRFVVIFVFWKSFKNVIYALLLMISIQKSCFGGVFSNYWKDCEKHLFKSSKKTFRVVLRITVKDIQRKTF